MRHWKRWHYKHLTYFLLSILVVSSLSRFEFFHAVLVDIGKLGYWGALLAGMLFVSTFTVAIGVIILFFLAESLPIVGLSIVAGVGGVLGDLIIFSIIRSSLREELHRLYYLLGGKLISRLFTKRSPFRFVLPVLGALIIASPFPDEIGISLLGVSKISRLRFILLAFILDVTGIFLLLHLA